MIEEVLHNLRNAAFSAVWGTSLASLPRSKRELVRALRVGHMLWRLLASGDLTMRAASLVFTTLLSLVPLLAVSFSVLKAFGVHNQLEDTLYGFLAPLGDKGVEITERIIAFVDNVNAGALGGVGLAVLFFTTISLVYKIESALNHIWRVPQSRSLAQRFSGYLSVLMVGPLLVFTALGVMGTVMSTPLIQDLASVELLGAILSLVSAMIPYALIIAAFTFIYMFMPNTRVRADAAFTGAVVAGLLWGSAGWAFAAFVTGSPRYTAIYSSFAIVFLFMLWLYVAWLILLIGAASAYFWQHPDRPAASGEDGRTSNRVRERVAVAAMARIAQCHLAGQEPPDTGAIAAELGVGTEMVSEMLVELARAGLARELADHPGAYLPARDVGRLPVLDVLQAARAAFEDSEHAPERLAPAPLAEPVLRAVDAALHESLSGHTLKDVVEAAARDQAEVADLRVTSAS